MSKSHGEGTVTAGAGSSSAGTGSAKSPKTKELWVQPKEKFMNLLKTVGAKGPKFTAQEVLSLLIKYISSRRLFDQDDPKKVYCSKDPLGEVFGVKMFTIQDAKRLLFENLTLLDVPGQNKAHPGQNPSCHFTFFQQSIKKPPNLDPLTAELSATSSRLAGKRGRTSSSSTTPSSVQSKRPRHRRRKRPKPKHKKDHPDGTANKDRGSISAVPPPTQVQTDKSKGNQATEGGQTSRRPWYCIVYTSSEDLQSKSSEILSVQVKDHLRSTEVKTIYQVIDAKAGITEALIFTDGKPLDNETIEAHDSSDDLWFLEDEFAVEFEVESSSSSTVAVSSEDDGDDTESTDNNEEIIVDLKVIDSAESRQGDYSSAVETDEELSEADKWRCTECNAKNTPICRYCFRCMAVRSVWLPDEQRMTLWERLHHQQGYQMKRASSAPASNMPQMLPSTNQLQSNTSSPRRHSPHYAPPIDVSDGKRNQTGPTTGPPGTPQHDTPGSSIPQVGTPVQRSSVEYKTSPTASGGKDEAGHSSDSSLRGLGSHHETRPPHGPASQKTLSPPAEERHLSQSTIKRPWALVSGREDSGLGQSLRTMSSHGATTVGSSQELPNELEPVLKRVKSETRTTLHSSQELSSQRGTEHPQGSGYHVTGFSQTQSPKQGHTGLEQGTQAAQTTVETRVGHSQRSAHSQSQGPEVSYSQGPGVSHSQGPAASHFKGSSPESVAMRTQEHSSSSRGGMQRSRSHHTSHKTRGPPPDRPVPRSSSHDPSRGVPSSGSSARRCTDLCMVCMVAPRMASIIHGDTGHQVCCYKCAKKLQMRKKTCPVCRKPIDKVVKNYYWL